MLLDVIFFFINLDYFFVLFRCFCSFIVNLTTIIFSLFILITFIDLSLYLNNFFIYFLNKNVFYFSLILLF